MGLNYHIIEEVIKYFQVKLQHIKTCGIPDDITVTLCRNIDPKVFRGSSRYTTEWKCC